MNSFTLGGTIAQSGNAVNENDCSFLVHNYPDRDCPYLRRSFVTRDVLLREAKALAFVVSNTLGLKTDSAEAPSSTAAILNLLAERLEVVQRISAVILGALSPEDAQNGKAVQ